LIFVIIYRDDNDQLLFFIIYSRMAF